jgi:hypothetical protein
MFEVIHFRHEQIVYDGRTQQPNLAAVRLSVGERHGLAVEHAQSVDRAICGRNHVCGTEATSRQSATTPLS